METWIAGRRREGRGIPVWNNPRRIGGICDMIAREGRHGGDVLNIRLVSLQSGIHPTNVIQNRTAYDMLLAAVRELGVEQGGMDTPISLDPDSGEPWRSRFDSFALADEERYLQTAAYIVCSYLTGMRDSEVQAMRPGCLRKGRSADGLIERLAIRSTIYKGRDPQGEIEEWVTIAPVAAAVEVAERLAARHRGRRQEDGIWIVLHRGVALERGVPHIVRQINRFRQHLDDSLGSADEPVIPQVNGNAWVFNTRQFRRTVAWYIANRPFGVVAGKIQYKHASVAMFDGYAGASTSGFRQEVEQERVLGQLDDIVAHYEAGQRGEHLAGPAAGRIHQEMDRVEKQVSALPGMIADSKRVKTMLAHLARTLHVGHLNDCFFEPATALCLARSAKPAMEPAHSNCAPDRCPNSCITQRHLPAWQTAIAHAQTVLADRHLSKVQRAAIRADRDRMVALVAPLMREEPA
jgi:integrase